jgi:hypothetical protein
LKRDLSRRKSRPAFCRHHYPPRLCPAFRFCPAIRARARPPCLPNTTAPPHSPRPPRRAGVRCRERKSDRFTLQTTLLSIALVRP